jgi:hypothetical protein
MSDKRGYCAEGEKEKTAIKQKNVWQKNKTPEGLVSIFLPDIFLLFLALVFRVTARKKFTGYRSWNLKTASDSKLHFVIPTESANPQSGL